jgi:cobalt-precorrin-7 (C5)-methyltransferase
VAKVSIVGVGPGSPDYVTPIARRRVQSAQIVIGAGRALDLFRGEMKGEILKLTAKNMNEVLHYAVESVRKGKKVALLSTGDPGFSGLLKTFLKATSGREVEIEVVPGISSIQACAARLLMSWDEARLFTFHDGASPQKKRELADTVKKGTEVLLFPNPKTFGPSNIARFLINEGVARETPAVVCENLTLDNEHAVSTVLNDILGKSYESLCVMVISPSRQQKGKKP